MATTKKTTGYDNWGNPGTGDEYFNTKTWTPYDYSNAPPASLYDTSGRFEVQNDYNDADLKRYTEDPYTQYYTGGGKYTAEQVYSGIQKEKEIYNAAMAAGDTAAAEAAHQRAEAWRATAGYSGGSDGSQMITLNGAGIGSMGVSASKDSNGKPKSATSDPGGYYVTYGGGYVDGSGSGQSSTPSAGYEAMKASVQGVNNDADDIARQLYINYMKNSNRTNELMGLSGLQGSGMQESSLVNLGNTYQENLYQNERARAESLQAVRTEIASMLAAGTITQAEADALYAGIAGGSFDIASDKTGTGGGYYEPTYTYYMPYATEQTSDTLTPSMTDAEMYNMLRGIGMQDSVIDTYFTPGQTAPTYQQIVDEYAALNTPQVQTQTGSGTPVQEPKNYTSDMTLNSVQRYAQQQGTPSAQAFANYILAGSPSGNQQVIPTSVLNTIPAQDQLSADVYSQVRRIAVQANEQQRLNEIVALKNTGRYTDEEIANMLYVLGLR